MTEKISHVNRKEFEPICNFVRDICVVTEESDAPEAFKATMKEFSDKASQLLQASEGKTSQGHDISELVVEIEQAADSALRASEESDKVDRSLVTKVKEAHDKVRNFKRQVSAA